MYKIVDWSIIGIIFNVRPSPWAPLIPDIVNVVLRHPLHSKSPHFTVGVKKVFKNIFYWRLLFTGAEVFVIIILSNLEPTWKIIKSRLKIIKFTFNAALD